MPARRRRCQRRGVYTIELILVLIVLVLATFVSLQFGIALIVKQAAAHAVTVAAREAAKANPPTPEELEDIIERVLAGHQITIGPDAAFIVEVPVLRAPRGTLPVTPRATPVIDGDEIRVTLAVSLTAHPILNILQAYGVDFTGRTFTISAVATRE